MANYLWTGQQNCYDTAGKIVSCRGSGQDGEFKAGISWPDERFTVNRALVADNLTGLVWLPYTTGEKGRLRPAW